MTDAALIAKLNQKVPEFVLDWCEARRIPGRDLWWEDDIGESIYFDMRVVDDEWIYFGLIMDAMEGKDFVVEVERYTENSEVRFFKVNDKIQRVEQGSFLHRRIDIAAGVAALKALEVWDE